MPLACMIWPAQTGELYVIKAPISSASTLYREWPYRRQYLHHPVGKTDKRKTALILAMLVTVVIPYIADARRGASSRTYGAFTFRTSQCISAECFRKHHNGTYVHLITPQALVRSWEDDRAPFAA